jgi:hypothetical protein
VARDCGTEKIKNDRLRIQISRANEEIKELGTDKNTLSHALGYAKADLAKWQEAVRDYVSSPEACGHCTMMDKCDPAITKCMHRKLLATFRGLSLDKG